MAYLFLDPDTSQTCVGTRAIPMRSSVQPSAELSRLEWSVVALASVDRLSTLRKPGRLGIVCGHLFGSRQNPALADPRLETLRRVAVLLWHDGSLVPHAEHEAFIAAGFTQAQYKLIALRIMSQARSDRGGRR